MKEEARTTPIDSKDKELNDSALDESYVNVSRKSIVTEGERSVAIDQAQGTVINTGAVYGDIINVSISQPSPDGVPTTNNSLSLPTKESFWDLRERVLQYLENQINLLSKLPAYFDRDFKFETVRQRVRVSQQRLTHRDFKTREEEATRRSGYFLKDGLSGLGYLVRGLEMYSAAGSDSSSISNWDDLRDKLHRGIILGDPGFGKTWLLKHEALRLAKSQANKLRCGTPSADDVVLPIFIRLGDIAHRMMNGEQNIQKVIADIVTLSSTLTPSWIECQIENGSALILLDALDEVDPHSRPAINTALAHFTRTTKSRILLSSRLAGYQRPFELADRDTEREVEIIAFDSNQVKSFIDLWFESEPQRGKSLLHTLQIEPALGGLARIPILLSFLCLLAKEDKQLPLKRVQLYETLLSHLLEGRWREEHLRETNSERTEAKLFLLEEIASYFSGQGPDGNWHDLMSTDELAAIIMNSRHAAFLRDTAHHKLGVLWELSERDGILVRAGTPLEQSERQVPYLFLHRTFHEYLLASYLARLEIKEWATEVQKHLWYDVDWEEPLVLLAGRLADWRPLISVLMNEENDVFNRMIILAGRCIAEVGAEETGIEAVLRELLDSESQSESKQARRALVMMRSSVAESLVSKVYTDKETKSDIGSDLIEFNPTHALAVFKVALNSENRYTRRRAITDLAKLDSEEAKAMVLEALDDPDTEVRGAAAEAIGDLNNEKVVKVFREQLTSEDRFHHHYLLIRRISSKGGADAVKLLTEVIEQSDRYSRKYAIEGLAQMGELEALAVLKQALKHPRISIRFDAAEALLIKEPEAALTILKLALSYDELLSEMVQLSPKLRISLPATISAVIKNLQADVETLKTPFLDTSGLYGGEDAFSFLIAALRHEDQGVRWIAAKLLCEISSMNFRSKLGRAISRRPLRRDKLALMSYGLKILFNYHNSRPLFKKTLKFSFFSFMLSYGLSSDSMSDGEIERALADFDEVLSAPEHALRALARSEDPYVVNLLIDGLRNPLPSFRKRIVEVLSMSKLEHIRRGLTIALEDPDPQVRFRAAASLKGDAKALPILCSAVADGSPMVRWKAVKALGEIGVDDGLRLMVSALSDSDKDVRWEAANILAQSREIRSLPILEEALLQKEWPWTKNSEAAKSLGEIGNSQAISILIRGLHSHWGAYANAASALQDFARGEDAVRTCADVLNHWPNSLSRKRDIAYRLISELAPEVKWTVGDEWPMWRARIVRRTVPAPRMITTILTRVLIFPFIILGFIVGVIRVLGRRLKRS